MRTTKEEIIDGIEDKFCVMLERAHRDEEDWAGKLANHFVSVIESERAGLREAIDRLPTHPAGYGNERRLDKRDVLAIIDGINS